MLNKNLSKKSIIFAIVVALLGIVFIISSTWAPSLKIIFPVFMAPVILGVILGIIVPIISSDRTEEDREGKK